MTIQKAIEDYLKDIMSPGELYSIDRRFSNEIIYDIAKVVVTLENGGEITIFGIEDYVYDEGKDTGFLRKCDTKKDPENKWFYTTYYSQPFVELCTFGDNRKIEHSVRKEIKEVKCYSRDEVSVEDLMKRYESYKSNPDVFQDAIFCQVKAGKIEKSIFSFENSHLLPAESMRAQVSSLKESLDKLVKGYEKNDLSEVSHNLIELIYTTASTCGLMNLPSEYLWDDIVTSKIALKPTAPRHEDIIRRWIEISEESNELSKEMVKELEVLKA